MTFVFDMDGTLFDLYGVDNWLPQLRAEDASPYLAAKPMINFSLLARYLNRIQRAGHKIMVVSWTSKESSPEYHSQVAGPNLSRCAAIFPLFIGTPSSLQIMALRNQPSLKTLKRFFSMMMRASGLIGKAALHLNPLISFVYFVVLHNPFLSFFPALSGEIRRQTSKSSETFTCISLKLLIYYNHKVREREIPNRKPKNCAYCIV